MTRGGGRLQLFLERLVTDGEVTAAVALAGSASEVEWAGVAGEARPGHPALATTRFDYGSLTKPFVATLALALEAAGELPLTMTLGEAWRGEHRVHPQLARRTLEELLRHRAGLQGWLPLYHLCRTPAEVPELLLGREETLGARRGTYSDLGYILFRLTAERLLRRPLAPLLAERVLRPLGASGVEVTPGDQPDVAISVLDTAKEVQLSLTQNLVLSSAGPATAVEAQSFLTQKAVPNLGPPYPGVPTDGNARFLGGLAGHAGLFGPALDLWRLGAEWLRPSAVLTTKVVARALAEGGPTALGWWRRHRRGSAGPALPASAFGHTGFSGGSLWLDPEAGRVLVLLAHRAAAAVPMNRRRRRFHALAYHDVAARRGR
jgi:CubicO group peptidase (beta-lactamase class C family)